jgi:hypothetical protein
MAGALLRRLADDVSVVLRLAAAKIAGAAFAKTLT